MKLYITYSKMPEMAGLTPEQRKAVMRCGMEAYFAEDPSRVFFGTPWMLSGLLLGGVAAWLTTQGTGPGHARWLWVVLGALVGAGLATFVVGQFVAARLRPYFRRVRDERREEIGRIH
jgi:hypothetical protein